MKYTQEEIYEVVRVGDLATIVSMIQDGVDVNNFMIYKKTDVLLVSIFKENQNHQWTGGMHRAWKGQIRT